ncbi:DUF1987 domain-containing protein [Propionispora hippei]|uniref:SiaC family regulatory phosphoprotein domain-containing protein n=1 Tax=Propionispora hippei DSM 15287 TaxID=1123003 RepID=A0A1M6J7E7_9FIRM|nr:DUF1987 domain-containing protein [Propionispora hippei]SHJ42608.1 protein of unknown function [Propionispora hippei DSM 15287]
MKPLHIEQTSSTPGVLFEPDRHRLKIIGQSYPDNAFAFYGPVFQWLDEFLAECESSILLELYFQIPYINAGSTKCILLLLEKLTAAYRSGKQVVVQWYYDGDSEVAQECAVKFQEDLELPFRLIPLEEDV